jgi:hypothetical protein
MTFSQIVFLYAAAPWIAARGNKLQMLYYTKTLNLSPTHLTVGKNDNNAGYKRLIESTWMREFCIGEGP